jgi:phage shock protein PspC (stress-responsive transcriptional regulator)
MRKVLTVSLNGNAYQIEESGYEALQAYLESAHAKLHEDPDCAEILADLEQAIAEKCNRFLSAHKTVVSAAEMQQILTEMGPVNGQPAAGAPDGAQAAADSHEAHAASGSATRRLYQIREGAMISGVCKGLAAYFNVDVAIVRLIFVALAIITWGAWILAYIVMMFVIPYASTSEERAAAHGQPFDAQHLIEAVKRQYAFQVGERWRTQQQRRQARAERRAWRREWRRGREQMRDYMRWYSPPIHPEDTSYAGRVLLGVLIPIAAVCNAVLTIAFLIVLAQLVTRGTVFGWAPPADIPLWADILILLVLLQICTAPLRATRNYAWYAHGPSSNVWFAIWGSILWIGFVIAFFWIAYQYWPDLAQFLQQLVDSIRSHRAHVPGDSILLSLGQLLQQLAT